MLQENLEKWKEGRKASKMERRQENMVTKYLACNLSLNQDLLLFSHINSNNYMINLKNSKKQSQCKNNLNPMSFIFYSACLLNE